MDQYSEQVTGLRQEINTHILVSKLGALIIGALAILVLAISNGEMKFVAAMLLGTIAWWIAMNDYLIKRVGAWIRMVEHRRKSSKLEREDVPDWETYLSKLQSRKRWLPIVDIGTAVGPVMVLLVQFGLVNEPPLVALVAYIVIGIIAIPMSVMLADW